MEAVIESVRRPFRWLDTPIRMSMGQPGKGWRCVFLIILAFMVLAVLQTFVLLRRFDATLSQSQNRQVFSSTSNSHSLSNTRQRLPHKSQEPGQPERQSKGAPLNLIKKTFPDLFYQRPVGLAYSFPPALTR